MAEVERELRCACTSSRLTSTSLSARSACVGSSTQTLSTPGTKNPGSEAVDLTGWHLTDSAKDLDRWTFPAVTIESRQVLLVWASSKNRIAPELPLHTNFSLSASGEYLALVQLMRIRELTWSGSPK